MKISKLIILSALVLLLAACGSGATGSATEEPAAAATNTPEPTATPESGLACLNGNWALVNIEDYMNSVVPPELASGLTFVGSSGTATTDFSSDGTYTYQLDAFQVQYTMDVGSGPIPFEVAMEGEGSGLFEAVDDHTIRYTEIDNSGVSITVLMGGEAIDIGMEDAASAFGSADSMFQFNCEGDVLQTIPPIDGALPVEYVRVP